MESNRDATLDLADRAETLLTAALSQLDDYERRLPDANLQIQDTLNLLDEVQAHLMALIDNLED